MWSKLTSLVMPPWVKFIPYVVIALLAGALYLTRDTLADTKFELKVEQQFRGQVANFANAKTGTTAEIMVNLYAIGRTSLNRKTALEQISSNTLAAKARADQADAALKREQDANAKKFAAAQRRITDLESRKGTGDATTDLKTIEEDSQAAWKGWK